MTRFWWFWIVLLPLMMCSGITAVCLGADWLIVSAGVEYWPAGGQVALSLSVLGGLIGLVLMLCIRGESGDWPWSLAMRMRKKEQPKPVEYATHKGLASILEDLAFLQEAVAGLEGRASCNRRDIGHLEKGQGEAEALAKQLQAALGAVVDLHESADNRTTADLKGMFKERDKAKARLAYLEQWASAFPGFDKDVVSTV